MGLKRTDAVTHDGRTYVPTSPETQWINTWAQFLAAGGVMVFNEDQTTVELQSPEGYKFGIGFQRGIRSA